MSFIKEIGAQDGYSRCRAPYIVPVLIKREKFRSDEFILKVKRDILNYGEISFKYLMNAGWGSWILHAALILRQPPPV